MFPLWLACWYNADVQKHQQHYLREPKGVSSSSPHKISVAPPTERHSKTETPEFCLWPSRLNFTGFSCWTSKTHMRRFQITWSCYQKTFHNCEISSTPAKIDIKRCTWKIAHDNKVSHTLKESLNWAVRRLQTSYEWKLRADMSQKLLLEGVEVPKLQPTL